MAERLILHIGSMKSGTSFVQNVLGHNREALRDQGILFAGRKWRDQVAAVQDLIGHGGRNQPALAADGPWHQLVAEINQWPGTAVVSMEFLAPRVAAKIEMIRDRVDGRVEAVLTGRDLARNVTAMWLESVQNGGTLTWEDYLAAVRAEDRSVPAAKNFWNHQGLAAIARRWSDVLGSDAFTLVTVPQKGAPPRLLWERFAEVLAVDPGDFELGVRANTSIGLATALVLRRLNADLAAAEDKPQETRFHDLIVKHLLTKRGLVARHADEPRLGLDEEWVLTRGTEEVRRLRKLGPRVVGDLDELLPRPVPGIAPSGVTGEQQLEAAQDALARMVRIAAKRENRHRRTIARLRKGRS